MWLFRPEKIWDSTVRPRDAQLCARSEGKFAAKRRCDHECNLMNVNEASSSETQSGISLTAPWSVCQLIPNSLSLFSSTWNFKKKIERCAAPRYSASFDFATTWECIKLRRFLVLVSDRKPGQPNGTGFIPLLLCFFAARDYASIAMVCCLIPNTIRERPNKILLWRRESIGLLEHR